MIRPRGGDFNYNNIEIEIMKDDIIKCEELGVYGIAIGILTKDYKINIEVMKQFISLAKNMKITFHMAFDFTINKKEAIDDLIMLGVSRILTRGDKLTAYESKEVIKEYIDYANSRVIILPGGGIVNENMIELAEFLNVKELHGTKVVGILD